MAKDRKKSIPEEELGEPSFDKQILDYAKTSDDSDDPIFSGRFFNFMDKLLTKRNNAFRITMVKEVKSLMTEYNDNVKSTISDLLTTQTATVGNVVGEVMVAIEGLEKKLNKIELTNKTEHQGIMTALADLQKRQDAADEKIKKEEIELKLLKDQVRQHGETLEFKKKRIDGLEKEVNKREKEILAKIKSIDDEIHGEVPIKIFRTYYLEKWLIAFVLAVLASTLITFFVVRKHAKDVKAAGHNGNVPIENTR